MLMFLRVIHLALFLALLALPAAAAGAWQSYENARYGYSIDVPDGFTWGREADNGDGLTFTSPDGRQTLAVFGGMVTEADFESEIRAGLQLIREDGWALSYERVTPTWASFSGTRNGMIRYVRVIALCGGAQLASFYYEYPKALLKDADPVVEHLVRSLKASDAAC
jgi:hypothetical protein